MSGPWIVFACRTDYAVDVAGIIERRREQIAAFVDNLGNEAPHDDGLTPILLAEALTDDHRRLDVVVPLITPGHRFTVVPQARSFGLTSFPALVDPTAVVAGSAEVGGGAVVNAGVVLAARVQLGEFVHVNRSASIGHHSVLEPFSTVGPGVVFAGRVRLARGAFVGAGATLAPGVQIGANAVVGAGAVVVRDVPAGAVVVGNPARVIKEPGTGYGGGFVP